MTAIKVFLLFTEPSRLHIRSFALLGRGINRVRGEWLS
jgi:hypothetical protein